MIRTLRGGPGLALFGGAPAASDVGFGRPVVLFHAFPADRRLFLGLAGSLDGRLIVPDFPGFGDSRLAGSPDVLSVERLADDLARWLESRRLGPVVLGGAAIGGYVALELADHRPDLVDALVLMGCKPAADAPERAAAREAVAQLALVGGSAAVAAELAALPFPPDADPRLIGFMRRMIERANPRAIAALVRGLARRPDPRPALERLRCPLLAIAGEIDPFTRIEDARVLAAGVPGAKLLTLPGVGHLPALERPQAVGGAISALLAELPPLSRSLRLVR